MGLLDLLKSTGNNAELLEWQNTLLHNPVPKLVMSKEQLKTQTTSRMENNLRIIKDCIRIMEDTIKPDVYFERLGLMEKHIDDLMNLNKYFEKYSGFAGSTPAAATAEFLEQKQDAIGQFLVRYFSSVFDKAEKTKTDKRKLNQYQKFYDSLQPYYSVMDDKNIDYIETKYKAYTRLIKTGRA